MNFVMHSFELKYQPPYLPSIILCMKIPRNDFCMWFEKNLIRYNKNYQDQVLALRELYISLVCDFDINFSCGINIGSSRARCIGIQPENIKQIIRKFCKRK